MAKISLETLLSALENSTTPDEQRDAALELLSASLKRQYVDTALDALESLADRLTMQHRPSLRAKALYYFENPSKDMAGMVRERIIRLLAPLCQPEDIPMLLNGISTYEHQPVRDVAQNLRAVSLAVLAELDTSLATAYAVKLLGEKDTSEFNGEPAMTAIHTLVRFNQPLLLYQFLLLGGRRALEAGKGEVVAKAFESLPDDLPALLFGALAEEYIAYDLPVVSSGIIDAIIKGRRADFYPLLETLLKGTKHLDLHRYGVIMLATARLEPLKAMLYGLAKQAAPAHAPNFIEALELTTDGERDALIAGLRKRAKSQSA